MRENSDDYRTIPLTEVIAHSSPIQALDPASFIVRARYELLGLLVECVLQGERFLALSGAPGSGKSVMARAIHDELLSRSVTVFPIERGESDNIGSRSIICQLLHKPEAEFQPDDVETLFDTLATDGDHGQRRAIIIDDAERLRPDALQYLRLVSNMIPEQMPPVVFVGHSSFWDVPEQPGSSDAHDLITCRMELERLSDEEAHAFISEKLPDAAHPWLDDATREALVRHAGGSIGRLAALLTAAQDTPGGRQTVINPADGQKAILTIDEPAPLATHGSALTILPTSDIVLSPVAVSPSVEYPRNAVRWTTVVRHVTAGALMLTVVGAIAYWQLTVYAGQIQRADNSVAPAPAASSGVGDVAQPAQEPSSASNAVIDDTAATEPPAQASPPLAGPPPSTSGLLHPSVQPTLTAPLFRALATDDADQPPAAMAAELSVAPSDDPDAVWLVLDSVSADLLVSLASAPAEQPRQSPTIGEPAAGTEPAAPQAQTAAVPGKPSEAVPTPTATPTSPPAAGNALAAVPASPDLGANIQPSPGAPQAQAAAVPDKPSDVPAPTATPTPPPAADNALAAVPASPDLGANIQPSPGAPQAQAAAVPDKPSDVPAPTATPTPPPAADNALAAAPVSSDPGTNIQSTSGEPQAQAAAVPDKPSDVPAPTATPTPPPAADNALAAAPVSSDPGTNIQSTSGEPQAQVAAVPDQPSDVPAPTATPTPPPVADNALAAASASPDPGAHIQPSPGDAGRRERNAGTAPMVASEPSNASTPTAEHMPLPAADAVAPAPTTVPALPKPVPDIAASPAGPPVPSGRPLVAAPSRPEQEMPSPPVLVPPAQVPPRQVATAPLSRVTTPDAMPATSPPVAAAPPVAAPHAAEASVDIATPEAPAAPTASVGNSAASLRVPEPLKPPPPVAPVASAPHLDLGLLLSRGNAMLALGDISAARLLYERAAALGSARAATALGNTYDAAFLASIQAKGIVADQAAAIVWYRKAAALGDTEAVRQLKRLAQTQ